MNLTSTARIYAKALFQLSKESNVDIVKEVTSFNEAVRLSNDLENVLFLGVFSIEEKIAVFSDIVEAQGHSDFFKNFFSFVITENRMDLFHLIYKELVVMDDADKGFVRGTIEGKEDTVSTEILNKVNLMVKQRVGLTPNLEYKKNKNITAGMRIKVEDFLIDATIDSQLDKWKNQKG